MTGEPQTAERFEANRALNQTFRHSFWARRRAATLAVFIRLQLPAARVDRFKGCGTSSWILRDPRDANRVRLATNLCRDRWCEACQAARRRIITRNVAIQLEGRTLRLLTLTLKSSPTPLTSQIDRLFASFRRFRQTVAVQRAMTGGLYFVEITLNEKTGLWHPHLHVIWEGAFLPHEVAKAAWLRITEDSYVIDLRPLHNSKVAASYVAKYASKAVDRHVWTCPDRFREAVEALNGRRTFSQFGTWHELDLSKVPQDDTHWEVLLPLHEAIRHAKAGDAYFQLVLRKLSAPNMADPFDLPEGDLPESFTFP